MNKTQRCIDWLLATLVCGIIGAGLVTLAKYAASCRSVIPITVQQTTYTCTATAVDVSGAITMDCKANGHKATVPVTGPSGTGNDSVELPAPTPPDAGPQSMGPLERPRLDDGPAPVPPLWARN